MDFTLNITKFTIAPHSTSASRLISKQKKMKILRAIRNGGIERVLNEICNIYQGHKEICLHISIQIMI